METKNKNFVKFNLRNDEKKIFFNSNEENFKHFVSEKILNIFDEELELNLQNKNNKESREELLKFLNDNFNNSNANFVMDFLDYTNNLKCLVINKQNNFYLTRRNEFENLCLQVTTLFNSKLYELQQQVNNSFTKSELIDFYISEKITQLLGGDL